MTTYDKIPVNRISYGIVLNDIAEESISTDINLSGWILGRATESESMVCSELLRKYVSLAFRDDFPNQEMSIKESGNGFQYSHLSQASYWRYSVIRPTDQAKLSGAQLSEALRISDANIFVEIWCIKDNEDQDSGRLAQRIGGHPAQCFQYLDLTPLAESLHPLDIHHLTEVVTLRACFDNNKYPSIVKAIEMFRALDVHPSSSLKMLGYFAVIESLLSHKPNSSDSADSIARQLKRNLPLLNNRMIAVDTQRSLGFNEFGNTKIDNVISRLYDYRSAIAHGGDESSAIKALTVIHQGWNLTEILWAERFLRRIVKRVIVQSMREPQLVVDLKG